MDARPKQDRNQKPRLVRSAAAEKERQWELMKEVRREAEYQKHLELFWKRIERRSKFFGGRFSWRDENGVRHFCT